MTAVSILLQATKRRWKAGGPRVSEKFINIFFVLLHELHLEANICLLCSSEFFSLANSCRSRVSKCVRSWYAFNLEVWYSNFWKALLLLLDFLPDEILRETTICFFKEQRSMVFPNSSTWQQHNYPEILTSHGFAMNVKRTWRLLEPCHFALQESNTGRNALNWSQTSRDAPHISKRRVQSGVRWQVEWNLRT